MKILLVDNLYDFSPFFEYSFCSGLLGIGTILHKKGYDVEILNFHYIFMENILTYTMDSEANLKAMADYIIEKSPHVVGFTGMCNAFHNSLLLSKLIKEKDNSIKIIFGGPHVSTLPEKILEHYGWIDLICTGEGEKNIVDIVEGLFHGNLSHINGIVYKDDHEVVRTPDMALLENLDDLPRLNYNLVKHNFNKYKYSYIPMEIGRGCPFNCVYCLSSKYWKRKYRMKSLDRITEDIKSVKEAFGDDILIFFLQDNLTTDRKFILSLCDRIKDLNVYWRCDARLDNLDEEILTAMVSAGCKKIFIGIESGSVNIQNYMKKKLNLNNLDHVMDIMLEKNILPIISFMFGFPVETKEDLNRTLNLINHLLKKGVYCCQLHGLCAFYGTNLFEECKDNLILNTSFYSDISESTSIDLCDLFISENKELFSHFYTLKGSLLETYPLMDKFVFYIMVLLYRYCPKSLNLMVKLFKNNILDFYKDFVALSDSGFKDFFKRKDYIKGFITEENITAYMFAILEDYIIKKSHDPDFNIALNTFNMEKFKQRIVRIL